MKLAPIVLFVYNRPEHTRKTLEALRLNDLASESILYVYADGAKENASLDEIASIEETRKVLKSQEWCKQVTIKHEERNKGLANSIIDGVTEIVNKYGKVIVLEDDIKTDVSFLRFMNSALNFYQYNNKVYHINGFSFESNIQFVLEEYYFLSFMNCWGWATWKDRWSTFNSNHNYYYQKLNQDSILKSRFNYENVLDFDEQLKANIDNRISTWAILWFCAVFFNNGLCLTPKTSLVENIGFDGSGTHNGHKDYNSYTGRQSFKKTEKYFDQFPIKESFLSRWYLKLFFIYGPKVTVRDLFKKLIKKTVKYFSK
jgi:GT2 family glycosyltransferase